MNCNGSYLCERLQRVNIGNSHLDWKTIQHVVPEESIWGSLLFKTISLHFCFLNMLSERCIPMEQYRNHFELQSWFKCNYLRYLSGEESNTKSITFINHDIIWLNQQAGKVNRTCFYCLVLVFIYLFIFCAFLTSTLSQSEFNAKNNLANIQPSQLSSRVVNNA